MTTVGKSDRKIRLAFIAPYPKMSAAITNVAEHMNINVEYVYASLEQGIVEARKIENRIDAICSRGGTGTLIKDNVEVPVVLIPTTPFDIIKSLWSLKEPNGDIAVFTYEGFL